jgi:hypothetical protein
MEWLQWTCGIGQNLKLGEDGSGESVCDVLGSIDPSNLNYPSIGIGALAGTQKVTRTVTNTTNQASVYVAKVQAPPGVTVKVTPSVITVLPRRSATYTVEFTRTSAELNKYVHGSITLADLRGHSVRSPFSVQPVALTGPAIVNGTGTSGSQQVKVQAGYTGAATATAFGLVAPEIYTAPLTGSDNDQFNPDNAVESDTVGKFTVTVPPGVKFGRISTYSGDYPAGTDVDLYVQSTPGGANQWASAGAGSDEAVRVGPGSYTVFVVLHKAAPNVDQQTVKMYYHGVGATNAGNLTVTPARQAVTLGREATFTVNWSGLTAGTRYLGVVEYGDGSVVAGDLTVVSIQA